MMNLEFLLDGTTEYKVEDVNEIIKIQFLIKSNIFDNKIIWC